MRYGVGGPPLCSLDVEPLRSEWQEADSHVTRKRAFKAGNCPKQVKPGDEQEWGSLNLKP